MKSVLNLLLVMFLLNACTRDVPPPEPFGAVPDDRQLKWHELEVIGMVNFSTITYYGKEWGYGDEDPARFNPVDFDAGQIVRAAGSAGMKALIIDAKHHGGFCLWPSRYTEYSVKNSPWKDGKGDMVAELAEACRKEGLQVAIYLSPWDRNHRDYGKEEYVTYYHNQLRELLTGYGPVSEIWFDGANGGDGWYGGAKEKRLIDRRTYYRFDKIIPMIRELQPDGCIFSELGPEIRWVGNESGFAGDPCWASFTPKYRNTLIPVPVDSMTGEFRDFPNGESNYTEATNGHRDGKLWIPAESDFPLRKGWFWHPDDSTRSAEDLVNRYFLTVGRNSTMDIGIAPDRRGLIDETDCSSLSSFGGMIQAVFHDNLAINAGISASNTRGNNRAYSAANITDSGSKFKTYWAADDDVRDAEVTIDFGKTLEFSVVSIREPIQLGQRIDSWALDAWQNGKWNEFASGTGIGARRLWRGQPLRSDKIRLRIINSSASPAISDMGVFLEPQEVRTAMEKYYMNPAAGKYIKVR